ncbi:uncharacterized protein LOC133791422 [Humulus lupulus]|uniref:uncharacterized protein LOC133791422 n=1 Tax=Humulus lupulus TaxID=3486 RepID=UPI002B404BE4|nr:uncharacterized protein LOC133791422 [Humulus lupulus]
MEFSAVDFVLVVSFTLFFTENYERLAVNGKAVIMAAYCNRLKVLADQLANVGAKISYQRLMLKLIGGLTEAYNGFVTVIQQRDPLPSFAKARSMLCLEAKSMQQRTQRETGSTSSLLVHSSTDNYASEQ